MDRMTHRDVVRGLDHCCASHTYRGRPSSASTVAAIRSVSGASMPASARTSRTTAARSARCSRRVLPDQARDTWTRRPPMPRFSRSWELDGTHAGDEAGAGVLGLDAVAQPVRALGRARQEHQLLVQPVDVRLVRRVGVLGVGVGVCDRLGEVLGQVPHRPVRVRARGDDPLDVDLGAEPHHHEPAPRPRRGRRAPPARSAAGSRSRDRGSRRLAVPPRQRVDVDGLVELGPPQLQVGRSRDRPDHRRGIAPRIARWMCGASRRCGSIAPKYCTRKPAQRRRFCIHRSNSRGKNIASTAARR